MYDTIHFLLPSHLLHDGISNEVIESVGAKLANRQQLFDRYTGNRGYSGNLKNLKVDITDSRLSIQGSLHKFHLGGQPAPMSIDQVKGSIRQLSELFALPIELALVRRVDIAVDIEAKHNPKAYFAFLGPASYYTRYVHKSTLYYAQNRKRLAFYDKHLEQGEKNQKSGYLLRYELRYLKQVKQQLNQEVTGATLYEPSFFRRMADAWLAAYKVIYKIPHMQGMESVRNVKDLEQLLLLKGIEKLGGINQVLQQMEQVKPLTEWDYQQHSRLRKKLEEIAETPHLTSVSPLIVELDEKAHAATAQLRGFAV